MMHPHWPDYTLQELEALVEVQAVLKGYQCIYQGTMRGS
jgi:hypothetical protein